ncbi:MAG: phosphopantetheine adenylyltransferase [Candidatus Bathyarchaeia archaeon]
MNKKFKLVAVGGTFDEFHKGHRALLSKAFEIGERVLIGLCTDEFVSKMKKPHNVAPYKQRLEELKKYLEDQGVLHRAQIVPLDNAYGVTLEPGCLDAIVVSKETELRSYAINEKRKAKGLKPLHVEVIDMVPAEDSTPISSTRIRRKEIDREGRLLV